MVTVMSLWCHAGHRTTPSSPKHEVYITQRIIDKFSTWFLHFLFFQIFRAKLLCLINLTLSSKTAQQTTTHTLALLLHSEQGQGSRPGVKARGQSSKSDREVNSMASRTTYHINRLLKDKAHTMVTVKQHWDRW